MGNWLDNFLGHFTNNTQDDYTLSNGEGNMAEYDELHADGQKVDVIRARPGYQTWPDDPIAMWMESWKDTKAHMERFLQSVGVYAPIDEVAILFDDETQKVGFIRDAVRNPGVKLFNSAWDRVKTSPIVSDYIVEYDFLEVEGLGMRVEAMRIDHGMSPLHEAMLRDSWRHNLFPVEVHYSFKVAAKDYENVRAAMVGGGAWLAQACESSYGKFAYYGIKPDSSIYLKPRINSRDEEEPVESDTPLPNTDVGHPLRGSEFGHPGVGGRAIKDWPQA